jgi:hypothetical protein
MSTKNVDNIERNGNAIMYTLKYIDDNHVIHATDERSEIAEEMAFQAWERGWGVALNGEPACTYYVVNDANEFVYPEYNDVAHANAFSIVVDGETRMHPDAPTHNPNLPDLDTSTFI